MSAGEVPQQPAAPSAPGKGLRWIRWVAGVTILIGVLFSAIASLTGDGPRILLYTVALTLTVTGLGGFPWFGGLYRHPLGGLLFGALGLALGALGIVVQEMRPLDWFPQGSIIIVATGVVVMSLLSLRRARHQTPPTTPRVHGEAR